MLQLKYLFLSLALANACSLGQTISGQYDCLPAGLEYTLCQNSWGLSTSTYSFPPLTPKRPLSPDVVELDVHARVFWNTRRRLASPSGEDVLIQPIGSQILQRVSIAGYTWNVWRGPYSNWQVISFVSTSGDDITQFSVDLKDFFDYLIVNQSVLRTLYVQGIQAGTEPYTGMAELITSSYETISPPIQVISICGADWKHEKFNQNSSTANFTKWSKAFEIHLSLLGLKFYIFFPIVPVPDPVTEPTLYRNWMANNNLAHAVVFTMLNDSKYKGINETKTTAGLYAA
ncbi:hypothetical protein C0995_008133 [Termitomyces sp. Mi166|nr:hypothetical protein C0995_008133 [Termitomyces sp. Mi166\